MIQYLIKDLKRETVVVITKEFDDDNELINKERDAYCNSNYDRTELQAKLPADLYNRIIDVWGAVATIPDLPDPRYL